MERLDSAVPDILAEPLCGDCVVSLWAESVVPGVHLPPCCGPRYDSLASVVGGSEESCSDCLHLFSVGCGRPLDGAALVVSFG